VLSRASDRGPADVSGRWELLRALGAVAVGPPAGTSRVMSVVGLHGWTAAEHTEVFVLSLPPYASIHLGPDGKLGGEAADRVAGIWRALGLSPPADADHLAAILALYAELGEAAAASRGAAVRERLVVAREAVLWEHLWSWAPGYLDAVAAESAAVRPWADLALQAITAEARASRPASQLPLALRTAPGQLTVTFSPHDLLDATTARARSGFILTRADIAAAAADLELGLRRGERRFMLRALVEQDAGATLRWLAGHAERWAARHRSQPAVPADPGRWWAGRAARTGHVLRRLAATA
jgi:hypothetical protein